MQNNSCILMSFNWCLSYFNLFTNLCSIRFYNIYQKLIKIGLVEQSTNQGYRNSVVKWEISWGTKCTQMCFHTFSYKRTKCVFIHYAMKVNQYINYNLSPWYFYTDNSSHLSPICQVKSDRRSKQLKCKNIQKKS